MATDNNINITIRRLVMDGMEQPVRRIVPVRFVEEAVGGVFGFAPEYFTDTAHRGRSAVDARDTLMHVLRFRLGMSVTAIAARYGVTRRLVFYSLAKTDNMCRLYPDYTKRYRAVLERLEKGAESDKDKQDK